MAQGYCVALDYQHDKVRWLTVPRGIVVEHPMDCPTDELVLELLRGLVPGIGSVTMVRIDLTEEYLTYREHGWFNVSATALEDALGVNVKHISDIEALVGAILAAEGQTGRPFGVIILNDADEKNGGYVRKYLVNGAEQWERLPFGENKQGEPTILLQIAAPLPLSQTSPHVARVIQQFVAKHPDIKRLFVWSPDGLPFQRTTYYELLPDGERNCRVTILNDPSFVLDSTLRQD